MKKLLLAAIVALAVVPFAGHADDVPDGKDCRDGKAASPVTTGSEPDRGAVCVHANGTTVFYIGGEAQAEEEGDPSAGGACGAIIVANSNVTGTEDWDNAGPDGEAGTADDEHCD